jgi:hypothetical protein
MEGGDLYRYLEKRQKEGLRDTKLTDEELSFHVGKFALSEDVTRTAFAQV